MDRLTKFHAYYYRKLPFWSQVYVTQTVLVRWNYDRKVRNALFLFGTLGCHASVYALRTRRYGDQVLLQRVFGVVS